MLDRNRRAFFIRGSYQGGKRGLDMKKIDLEPLRKEQARLLRRKGMGYGKIAVWTGLNKDTVRYSCREIHIAEENRELEADMISGKACRYCGEDLPEQSGRGRRRHFCNNSCRRNYWKIHRSEIQPSPEALYLHICTYCGKTFEVYGKAERKYCSRRCYMRHRNGCKMTSYAAV